MKYVETRRILSIIIAAAFVLALIGAAYRSVSGKAVPAEVKIVVSFAGDCTLGTDERYGVGGSFVEMFGIVNSYSYFFENAKPVFDMGDLAVVNLETTLTNSTDRAEKKFSFKGPPEFAEILREGGVHAVSVANNHTNDYFKSGYDETLESLESAGIGHFGNGDHYTAEVKGLRLAFLGYTGWSSDASVRNRIKGDVERMRDDGADLVFVYFHWGEENVNYPNMTQTELGRFTIDAGADLVVGSHPHVMQGVELYSGRYIVYSLGNFAYGGHKNPQDKDTFILQYYAVFKDGVKAESGIRIVPFLISSVKTRNDYRPTPAEGEDFERIIARLNEYSGPFGTVLGPEMFKAMETAPLTQAPPRVLKRVPDRRFGVSLR